MPMRNLQVALVVSVGHQAVVLVAALGLLAGCRLGAAVIAEAVIVEVVATAAGLAEDPEALTHRPF
jgi:hypothetical protein